MRLMMEYKGIIFDLDGVICSTDEYHYLAWKTLADRLSVPFDRERNHLIRGLSRMASLEIILEKSGRIFSETEKNALAEEKNQLYRKLLCRMSPADLSEDVKHTLLSLRSSGIKLAIGSSSKNTPFILERIGLGNFFDAPDPEVFLKAAAMLGLQPSECLVVDDAHSGIEAALAGGFDCAATGYAEQDDRAKFHLSQLSDLVT